MEGPGPHYVVVSRLGFRRLRQLVTVDQSPTLLRAVLDAARGAELARDALTILAQSRPTATDACVVARATGSPGAILAWSDGPVVRLADVRASDCEVERTAQGRRERWEPAPFAALALSLAGHAVRPVTVALSAPSSVPPRDVLRLDVEIDDPLGWVRRVRSVCGDQERVETIVRPVRRYVAAFETPEEEGEVRCAVEALAAGGRAIAAAPRAGPWIVEVRARGGVPAWVFVVAGAVLVGAAVAVGVAVYEPPQRLVFDAL